MIQKMILMLFKNRNVCSLKLETDNRSRYNFVLEYKLVWEYTSSSKLCHLVSPSAAMGQGQAHKPFAV
jgi:hypothetical protein